jgi:hypothetical protein
VAAHAKVVAVDGRGVKAALTAPARSDRTRGVDLPAQKGFYDSKRQFQGHDSPEGDSSCAQAPEPTVPSGIPRGQVVMGLVLFALLAVAFWKFALPEKIPAVAPPAAPPAAAAHP